MSDLLGGLGGLVKGFSAFMPQDDPDVKLMTAQSELNELQQKETALYADIGRAALLQESGRYPDLEGRLKLVQENMAGAQKKLTAAREEKNAKEAARQEQDAARTCPVCGTYNPEGTKFCQECGVKLGGSKCGKCGAPLSPGTRFCGKCGAKQEE